MGADITGWVEVKAPERVGSYPPDWIGVINVSGVVGRNYSMFALLFDMRNRLNTLTPFAHRGIPDDLSQQTLDSLLEGMDDASIERAKAQVVNPSWLTWRAILSLGWDEEIEDVTRVPVDWGALGADPAYEYTEWEAHPTYKGFEIILRRKISDPTTFWETFYRVKHEGYVNDSGVRVFSSVPRGVFQLRRPTWRDQQQNGWDKLFKLMATLAEEYGDDNVRLVGWFDQL